MSAIYNISIYFYKWIISLVSLFNPKAKQWISGRKNWQSQLQNAIPSNANVIWFHAASLGEFEQGRPLIEKIKSEQSNIFILLSFFSPSGYEIQKNYTGADYICYLPADTKQNARKFIYITQPKYVFFIKYEFWFNYMNQLKQLNIPLYLISGIFRPNQIFFKPYGNWFKSQLKNFSKFYLQNQRSLNLINTNGFVNAIISGDTRFDRVIEIAKQPKEIPAIKEFISNKTCMVIGSSWPQDEELLAQYINNHSNYKYILAPHEIHNSHLKSIEALLKVPKQRYSDYLKNSQTKTNVIIIDNIGMLSSVYQYAKLAYIGGAFSSGLHNILEAAVYGIPIVFGPKYSKFQEANDLIQEKGAFSISTEKELSETLNFLFKNQIENEKIGKIAKNFIYKSQGAIDLIYDDIFRKNL